MKHKVGDTVTIKSLDWYNKNKKVNGTVDCNVDFVEDMSKYCGRTAKIVLVDRGDDTYQLDVGISLWWSDDMFEEGIRFIKKKDIKKPLVINKDYILSDRLASIDELDELEKNKEYVAWYDSDTGIYLTCSSFEVKNWSKHFLKKEFNNLYKVIRNDKANIIVEALAKENIIYGENIKKAIDITRKILNRNE